MSVTFVRRVVLDRFGVAPIVLESDEVIVHCIFIYDQPDGLLLVIRTREDAQEKPTDTPS